MAKLDDRPPRGWFLQLVRRLALLAVVGLVGVVLAVYWLIHSL